MHLLTYQDLIKRAMRSLGVLHHAESPTADEAADALNTLNDMLNSWRLEGIDLEHIEGELTDEVPYSNESIPAIRYNLAMELAPEFGVEPSMVIVARATNAYRALQAEYSDPDELRADEVFRYIPNEVYGYYKDFS